MKKRILWSSIFLCSILTGCSEQTQAVDASTIFSVSDFAYTLNDKQAVSISFGETEANYCSVTIYRSSVTDGYKVSSNQKSNKDISADCNWAGKSYVQSSKHSTSASFEFSTIDFSSKTATALVSLSLVEPSSGEYFELSNIPLVIDGNHFDHLTKSM